MQRKLAKLDSLKATQVFGNTADKYRQLENKLKQNGRGTYIPKLDSLATSLRFLEQNPQLLSRAGEVRDKLQRAIEKTDGLKNQFTRAEEIKKFIQERKQYLKQQLENLGFAKELKKLNKQAYYYSQQVNEYKAVLKDSRKAEKRALELLAKTKAFKDFMRKHSQLASLFRMPDPGAPVDMTALAGLQTRAQVNTLIQQQISAGGPNARAQFSQNLQQAQARLNDFKDKVLKSGGGSSDSELPDFKPNDQKTKSFLDRLEYGTNIQSQKVNSIFPATTDIGLSVGYKLNNRSIIGIGASFKMGWGTGWRKIRISAQGIGLRSFLDVKLKNSFWLSGGFEMNYRNEINAIEELKNYSAWQQSGLIGVSKTVSLKTKLFKKTKLQLLWDVLSYRQVPRAQPIVFRIGYSF